jgi:lipoprotein-anchoring transpeptidase ErfK/SrfK
MGKARLTVSIAGLALLVGAMATLASTPALAQWRSYSGYEAYPAYPPYAYPAYPDYPVEPPARPYGSRPSAANGQDDYYSQYYGGASRYPQPNGQSAYREPGYGGPSDRGDLELGVNSNERTATRIANPTNEPPGTIVVDTHTRHLYLIQPNGEAIQYGIGVGRQGFEWKGSARVGRKAEWPRWIPPKEMLKRRPDLPESMDGGLENPLGARALYLFQGNKDTLFRIHGTNEPDTIGKAVSSGCIRMMNADVIDLYQRVGVGSRVVVL